MDDNLKILIVDDVVTYRQILVNIISEIKNTEVIGTASNGKLALAKIELKKPDLVLLDIDMPVMNGIETLKEIKKKYDDIEVIMVSGMDKENANLTVNALELGALDFISKIKGASADDSIAELKQSLNFIFNIVKTKKFSRQIKRSSFKASLKQPIDTKKESVIIPEIKEVVRREIITPVIETKRRVGKIDVVAIGVSTGGPNALNEIIPQIAKDIPVPILAVQHMPPTFTASLAERLDKLSHIRVVEAKDYDLVEKGFMYIAPGGFHMIVKKIENQFRINIIDSPPVKSCKPSVDVLFRSVGMVYGGNILTVILTGMGNDGSDGVLTIRRKGGYSIIQDEKTSVVWGMPGAVAEANAYDDIIPLNKIADKIMEIVWKGK